MRISNLVQTKEVSFLFFFSPYPPASLLVVLKLKRVHVHLDGAATVAAAFLLRLLMAEALAPRDKQVLAGLGTPALLTERALIRIITQARIDFHLLGLDAAEGHVLALLLLLLLLLGAR